jgi:hypothetical protein
MFDRQWLHNDRQNIRLYMSWGFKPSPKMDILFLRRFAQAKGRLSLQPSEKLEDTAASDTNTTLAPSD